MAAFTGASNSLARFSVAFCMRGILTALSIYFNPAVPADFGRRDRTLLVGPGLASAKTDAS